MAGDSYSASASETDASAQTSGNIVGASSSADRISNQFINLGSGTAALDLNSYLGAANAGFYGSIRGEQNLESGMNQPQNNTFKYVALGSGLLVGFTALYVLRAKK